MLTRTEELRQMGLQNLSISFDCVTVLQLDAIAKMWGESRSETVRMLVEWGMEGLDGQEKKILEDIAGDYADGTV